MTPARPPRQEAARSLHGSPQKRECTFLLCTGLHPADQPRSSTAGLTSDLTALRVGPEVALQGPSPHRCAGGQGNPAAQRGLVTVRPSPGQLWSKNSASSVREGWTYTENKWRLDWKESMLHIRWWDQSQVWHIFIIYYGEVLFSFKSVKNSKGFQKGWDFILCFDLTFMMFDLRLLYLSQNAGGSPSRFLWGKIISSTYASGKYCIRAQIQKHIWYRLLLLLYAPKGLLKEKRK